MKPVPITDCWNRIGIRGNKSCPELKTQIHCRNCPVYEAGGRALLEQEPPSEYVEEWTALLALEVPPYVRHEKTVQVFRIANEWLALPTPLFVEIVPSRPVRQIPHHSTAILQGMISVRGIIHLCFSMAGVLGFESAPIDSADAAGRHGSRICVIRRQGATWAFFCDEVLGVQSFNETDLQPMPVTVAKAMPRFTRGVLTRNHLKIGLLDEELMFHVLERSLT